MRSVRRSPDKRIEYRVLGDLGRLRGREVVVFDIDGVLIDNRERYRASLEEVDPGVENHAELAPSKRSAFWRVFLSEKYMHLDRPVREAVEYLRRRREEGYGIVILTGRPDSLEKATLRQLNDAGAEFDALIMRGSGCYAKEVELKMRVARELEDMGISIAEWHDDNEDVVLKAMRYAVRGVYAWYAPGRWVYVPPTCVVLNGRRVELPANVSSGTVFDPGPVRVRYIDYVHVLPSGLEATGFLMLVESFLESVLCYPYCSAGDDALGMEEVIVLSQLRKGVVKESELVRAIIGGERKPLPVLGEGEVIDLDEKLGRDVEKRALKLLLRRRYSIAARMYPVLGPGTLDNPEFIEYVIRRAATIRLKTSPPTEVPSEASLDRKALRRLALATAWRLDASIRKDLGEGYELVVEKGVAYVRKVFDLDLGGLQIEDIRRAAEALKKVVERELRSRGIEPRKIFALRSSWNVIEIAAIV